MLSLLFDAYSLVVFVTVIVSWMRLPEDHPVVRLTHALTEPLLAPIRRFLPTIGGVDFSPMLLLFFVRALRKVLLV